MKRFLLLVAGFALLAANVRATVLYWSGSGSVVGGNGTWDTTNARWGTSTAGPFTTVWNNANTDSAIFTASGSNPGGSVVVGTGITVNGTLQWEQTPGTFPNYTLNGSSTITFAPGSTINTVGAVVGSFNGPYAGTITKVGTAQLTFNNANGNVTKFILNQGTADFSSFNRFGSGVNVPDFLTFNGGVLRMNTTTAWTMGKSITVNAAGGTITSSSTSITLTQNQPITWNNGNLSVNTSPLVLSSTTSTGTGTLTLSTSTTCNAPGVIPPTVVVQMNSGATLTLNGFDQSVAAVSGSAGTVALGARSLTIANPAGQTYSSAISGTGGGKIIKSGGGPWTISGGNSYDGGLTINNGTLFIGGNTAPGTGTFSVSGGTRVAATSSTGRTFTMPMDLNADMTFGGVSPNNGTLTFGTGAVTLKNGDRQLTVDTITMTINSVIGQDVAGRGLIKMGSGTLVLNGANTYNGTTTVGAGILAGTGTIAGPVIVTAGTLSPGVGGLGTLTINNSLQLNGTTIVDLNRASSPNSDRVTGLTSVNYGGTLTVNNLGAALQNGDTFTLFSASTYGGSFSTMNLPTLSPVTLFWDTSQLPVTGKISVKAPPINLGPCPANITTNATSGAGAVVTYSLPTASGGCTPPTVVGTPPSGSTFPIGTNTVTVTASDTCGQSVQCTFTVTVNPPPILEQETFFTDLLIPPTNSVYIPPPLIQVSYGTQLIIRNAKHRNFNLGQLPPPLGQTNVENFSSEVDFEYSTDNGATFQSASGTALVQVQVVHSSDVQGVSYYNTEMQQLDLTGPGFMLRESPTFQSTGQTTIRPNSGGYMISSFFDVWTELSLNGGATWIPASNAHHMVLRKDPRFHPPVPEPTPLLPPPNDKYVSPAQWHALFAQGIEIKDVSHKLFTTSYPPPTSGTNTHIFGSTLDMQISTDGGNSFQFVRVTNAPVSVDVSGGTPGSDVIYDTEMTGLNISLPSGIMVRESPSLPSRGGTEIQQQPDGTFLIGSFFDIFTELSLDGGATWSPATNGPVHMELVSQAPEAPKPNPNLPPTVGGYVSPAAWHALYAQGIIITNASHDKFTQTQPPPPPGGSQIENFSSDVSFQYSTDGGVTFTPATAQANVTVNVNSRSDLDALVSNGTRFFDTEMTSLDISGGNLPPGMMIRESPTLASAGKTTVRQDAGNNYHVSSFFDIFTELSLDGGATWSPATNAPGTMAVSTNTPGSTLTITCPSNITVTASSPAGAVVFYTISASGGCPPVSVVANPPSGSTFPIGTTTVNALATDNCGQSAPCSFTVTVNPQPTPQGPEYFFTQPVLPPPGSVYISPALWHLLFNNGIVIRDVRHRFFTQNYPLPPLGSSQPETFSSELDFDISFDNGATFTPSSGTAAVTVQVTHSQDVNGVQFYDTEMLQLDLTTPGGPTGTIHLRESPTLQSTGQTTVRPVAGGYMVSSFFDVFAEISLDNGNTWTPAQQSGHVEMHPDTKTVNPAPEPTPLLPPPNGTYISPQLWHALYAQGVVIRDVRHKLFTGSLIPPTSGKTNLHNFNSQIDLQVSNDGGATYQYVRVQAPVTVTVAAHGSGANMFYDTEMISMSLSLPSGIMVRESPSLPSRGQTEIVPQGDGTYKISSFFDIFTELSLDGGATWSPATNGPVRMELTSSAPEVPKPNPNLPPLDGSYVSPAQWHALYANGIIITNASHDRFTQTQPPPPPGGSQTENFGSTVSGLISMNGGASFQSFSAPASVAVQVNSRSDEDNGSTRFFDTEMLSLQLSGGTLPGGVMVRESPSKASLGRTSVRTDSSQYQISSFFDIFTEVSLDGGATWSPSITHPGGMGLNPPPTNTTAAIQLNCSSNLTVSATSPSGATVFFTSTATGGCSPPPNIVCNPPSGSTFPIGTTTVTCTASDTCGSSTNCSFTITVTQTAINLNCSSNLTVFATSSSGATVFFTSTATGGCSPPPFINCNPPSGSTFPIGTSTVTCSASDPCGSMTNCSFTVTIVKSPINLNCSSNLVVTAAPCSNSAVVFFTSSASGGCDPAPMLNCMPPSGSSFPVGTTTVTCSASDSCGTMTNCSFTITVNPYVCPPLALNCSSNITVPASGSGGATVFYTSSASGGCTPPPSLNCSPPSGSTFPIGTTTVGCMASDGCGHSTNCSFTVTVTPAQILLNCSSNIVVTAPPCSNSAVVFFSSSASGGCSPPPFLNCMPPSGSSFPLGTTTVTCTASDSCGGSTNCSFTITVNPYVCPPLVLNCSSNLSVPATSPNGAVVFYTSSASGGCTPPPFLSCSPPSGSTFPIGTTSVSCMASDGCGHSTNCSFTVTVFRPPILLNCSSNIVLTAQPCSNSAVVFFSSSASGGCSPPPSLNCMPPSGSSFPLGITTVTCNASDSCGTTTNCSFTVTVNAYVCPPLVLNCSSNLNVPATSSSGAVVFYSSSASGGCTPPPSLVCNPPSGSTFPIGATSVSCMASDGCGHSTNCSFTITVFRQPPDLTCSSNLTVTATSSNGAVVFFTSTTTGGCNPTVMCNPPSGSTFPIGTSSVTCTASDPCGGFTNCSFLITVVRPPISLTCSSNLTVTASSPGGAVVFYTSTATGGCSTPNVVCNPPSGSTFPIGTSSVTCTATDSCGSTNCSFTVTVKSPPINLTCSTNITVTATGPSGAVVFFTSSATGGCSPPIVVCNPPSGSTFPVGTTTVTCNASDTCGGFTNCSFLITVLPPLPPSLEYFSVTNVLPPPDTVYISPALWHALYGQGIIIRDIRHRFFTQSQPPPTTVGATQLHTFSSEVDFELSTDNGVTYQPITVTNANVSVQVTYATNSGGLSTYTTEMLSLDLTSGNIRLRESPTLQSTGQTTVRPVAGGFMATSFFDIFTELSLDGGNTWTAASQSAHVDMHKDPRVVPTVTQPTPLLPSPNDGYISPAKWHALFAQGIVIKDVSHKFFTGSLIPPSTGQSNQHSFNSTVDLKVSTDGGQTFQFVRVTNAPVQVTVASTGSGSNGMYESEMTGLTLSNGLPNGIRLRESPSLPSRGGTQIDAQPDGTYRIGSFFDIFTELSVDGGNTWQPNTNGPVRMQLSAFSAEVPSLSQNLPITNTPYVSPADWHAAYASGIYISNVTHRGFTQNYPPPAPGASQPESFGSTVDLMVSTDGGHTFVPASVQMNANVMVTSHSSLDLGGTRFFDTEMVSLDLTGGTLPGGIRLRESPTRASAGRTSIRPDGQGGYKIDSFFDIFAEVSTDGGVTWQASTNPPARMAPRLPQKKRYFPQPNLPATNSQYISPKQWHALYANGIIISNVSHKRFLANMAPPAPRTTNFHNFGSTVTFLLKMPGGQFQPMTANADCQVSVGSSGFQGKEQVFQTEMLSLNLSGGTLPAGVMIRESPTRRSTGESRYSSDSAVSGSYRVSSFFDIFTEVSTDAGQTWTPADSSGYMELHIDPGVPPTMIVQPRLENGVPKVTVASQLALKYLLQYKNDLTDPTWTTISITSGTGDQLDLIDCCPPPGPSRPHRIYRVEIDEDDSY
jgi:autotransporter-associated beta strand protein